MRDRHPEINIGVYESKDKTTCHFCSASILSKSLYFHFNKQQCKNNFYANNGWSIIFNETDVTSFKEEQFFTQLSITNGRYMVYVVRKNSLINDWCYVGITNALEKRFNQHKTDKTFGMYESVEYGVLKDGLSYENASLIEALLLMASQTNLLNIYRESDQIIHNIPCDDKELFHYKVASWHRSTLQYLFKRWDEIVWIKLDTQTNKKTTTVPTTIAKTTAILLTTSPTTLRTI
uniref:GIY-YIG domain-containing protein n=1 Tax=Meloidogyne incognita TaxID=6306 RepID=A0A914KMI4_MELIC